MPKIISDSMLALLLTMLVLLPSFTFADKPSTVTAESIDIESVKIESVKTESINMDSMTDVELDSDIQNGGQTKNDATVAQGYIADIRVHTAEELAEILRRAEILLDNGDYTAEKSAPVVFLLHGDEARILFKNQYSANKQVVDLAAKLSAFDVIDIRICDSWLERNNLDQTELQPFIGSVEYAPAEEKRLVKEEQYRYF